MWLVEGHSKRSIRSTFQVSKRSGFYPCPAVDGAGTQVVSQAGAVLLTDTLATVGLDRVLSTALGPWRPRWAVHDPAKVLLDLALGLAIGGDCMARGHRSHADLRRATPAPSACRVRRPLQQRAAASGAAAAAAITGSRAGLWPDPQSTNLGRAPQRVRGSGLKPLVRRHRRVLAPDRAHY